MINTLILSDLHLGDTECLLYNNAYDIIDLTIEKIAKIAKSTDNNPFLKRLVLAGDIPDLSQADTNVAYAHTKCFLKRLLDRVQCEEIVYIPGNHDHHFWVELIERIDAMCCGKAKGDYNNSKKTDRIIDGNDEIVKECTRKIIPDEFNGKVSISYPNYEFEVYDSHFFVTHGHYFSKYWCYFFPSLRNEEKLNLEMIEETTYKFTEAVWWRRKRFEPFLPIEFLYDYLLHGLPLYLKYKRKSFKRSNRKYGTSFEEDSTLGGENTIEMMKWYLEKICKIDTLPKEKDFHLIYGHTHQGGRILKKDAKIRIKGYFISLWNLGGWIVPSQLYSPDAYIFYVKEDEAERKAIPDMVKIVAKPEPEKGEGAGDYDRDLLELRLKRIGQ